MSTAATCSIPAFALDRCVAFDLEVYQGRWMVGFYSPDPASGLRQVADDRAALAAILGDLAASGKTLVGYNSRRYDVPMLRAIRAGRDTYDSSRDLINGDRHRLPEWVALAPPVDIDHIDLAARLERGGHFPSLKAAAANLGFASLRDLPYEPDVVLTDGQWREVAAYNRIDLLRTWRLLEYSAGDLKAMAALAVEAGFDARSLSEQKAAERLLARAYRDHRGSDPTRMPVPTSVYYEPPPCVVPPESPLARDWHDQVVRRHLRVGQDRDGRVQIDAMRARFPIGPLVVSVGQGGLHTEDEARVYYPDDGRELYLVDAASYYPTMVARFGFMPRSYGDAGREIYQRLLDLRLRLKAQAAAEQDPIERASLEAASKGYKLALNSVYGKFKDRYSTLFDPAAQIEVSFTGQLLLIHLIERLQAVDCAVVSANTDGLFLSPPRGDDRWRAELRDWETRTGMVLEESPLRRLVILAGNNYACATEGGKVVRKGASLNGSLSPDSSPNFLVVRDAIANALLFDIPPERTIYGCQDPVRFCAVVGRVGKTRKLFLVGDGRASEIPGRVIRWYRARGGRERIERGYEDGRRATVADADSVGLAMDLPDGRMPGDVDFAWYIARARQVIQKTPGYRHLAPDLLGGHRDATRLHNLGLVPIPKKGKAQPAGSSVHYPFPTYLWEWDRFDSVGLNTGPAVGALVIDVDDPVKFKAFVTRAESPTLVGRWDDLAGCLVSYHGDVGPGDVRRGDGRGKLIFRCPLPAGHKLASIEPARFLERHGFEVFFGRGLPTILGRHPSGEEYRLDGRPTEPPAWLIELITPRGSSRSRPSSKPADGSARGEDSLDALIGELAIIEPALDPAAISFRRKSQAAGFTFLVGRCPFEHESGASTDGDLAAGFNHLGESFLRCKHQSCERSREVDRLLKERHRSQQAEEPGTRSSPIELTPMAAKMAACLDRAVVSSHAAPTGSGKSFAIGQLAAHRYHLGLRTVVAVPSMAHAVEAQAEIAKHAPEAIDRGAVCMAIGVQRDDEGEGDDGSFHYPVRPSTRIIITSHQQLGRRGFSQYLRGIWPLLAPDEERGLPAYAILVDEESKFLGQLRREIPLAHRVVMRNDPNGGKLVTMIDCPMTAGSGNCGNCRLRDQGVEIQINGFGVREPALPGTIPLERGTGEPLSRPQSPLEVSEDDFRLGPEVRIGDTALASRVLAFQGHTLDPARRPSVPLYYWRAGEREYETPEMSLRHLLDFAFRPVITRERPHDHRGDPLESRVLHDRLKAGDKQWSRGVVFPLATCEVARLQFVDLMPLEQLRRFHGQYGVPVLFAGATPLPDDPDILREVFGSIEEVVHPYPDRRIKQVLLAFPEGRHGRGGMLAPDKRTLITAELEACGPQLIFAPTKDRARNLYQKVREAQGTVEMVEERDRVMEARRSMSTDLLARTVITYSRGILGVGSNRMLGLRCVVVDANAFRRITSFTPEEIGVEAFARMRAEERAALILQNVGRGLRGESGKTLALIVFNADPDLRQALASTPAIVEGSEEPPVTACGEDRGILVDQVRRWLEAGGGPVPEPDPSKVTDVAGRPARQPRATPEDARAAAQAGRTYRDYYREHHVDRLSEEERRVIKRVFNQDGPKGRRKASPRKKERVA